MGLTDSSKDFASASKSVSHSLIRSVRFVYAERHVSAYKTASVEAGKYRAQIEALTETMAGTQRETAAVEEDGPGKTYSDEVRAIARKHDVDLGVAQDMYNNDQRHKGEADYVPYGGSGSSAGRAVAAAAGAIGAAVAGMAASVTRTVEKTVKNSASVTIHQAPSLTEGQVARSVRKVLDEMGR